MHKIPYKCAACKTSGKYITAIDPKDLQFRCPHDNNVLEFGPPTWMDSGGPILLISPGIDEAIAAVKYLSKNLI